jgi:hypothetical protein
MNTKHVFVIAVLAVLSVSLFVLIATIKSEPVKALASVGASNLIFMNEPAVRMQSGPIRFSDNNAPDFRPHAKTPSKPNADTGCIAEENANLRRYGGCVQ